jgi:putative transposase
MPRRARVTLPGVPHHLIQRGNNRQPCFFSEDDYHFYLDWLKEYAKLTGCAVHAYVLMTNHVHLLITPKDERSLWQLMKRLGQRYVQYINRTYRRSGGLWEGRYRSCITQEEDYVLACYRYIELNPVRAGMVEHPSSYPWSSYCMNGEGQQSELLTPHRLYLDIDAHDSTRLAGYRELFRYQLDPGQIDDIRTATNGNLALGGDRFKQEVAAALGRRVTRGSPGRPLKNDKS